MADKADIKELAVAAWRLEKWLGNLNTDRKMAAKSALRSIKKFIAASGVEVKDPVGSKFDPGLAVEVVNNEADDEDEEDLIIIETLAPYVYQNGELIQHARVIIGTIVKEAKISNEIKEESVSTAESSPEGGNIEVVPTEQPAEAVEKASQAETTEAPAEVTVENEEEVSIGADEIERMMAYAKIL